MLIICQVMLSKGYRCTAGSGKRLGQVSAELEPTAHNLQKQVENTPIPYPYFFNKGKGIHVVAKQYTGKHRESKQIFCQDKDIKIHIAKLNISDILSNQKLTNRGKQILEYKDALSITSRLIVLGITI